MENVLCKTESEFNRGFVGPLFWVTYSKHMIQVNDQIIFSMIRNGIPSSSGARVLGEEHEDVHGSVIGVGTIVGITTGYAFLLIIVLRLDLYDVANHRGTTRVQVEVVLAELYNAISQTTNTLNFFAGLCNSVGVGGYLNGGSYGFLLNNSGSAVVYVADVRFIGDELFWAIDSGGVYNNDEREPLAKCFKAIPERGRVVIITLEVSVAEMVTNILEAILYCLNIVGNIITRWVVPNVFKFGVVDPIVEMVVDTEWHIWHARAEEIQFQVGAVSFRARISGVHSSVMALLIVTVIDNNVDGARQNPFVLLARVAVLDDFKDDLSHLGWKLLSRKVDTVFRDLNLLLHHHTKVDFIERFSEMLLNTHDNKNLQLIGHNPYWRRNVSFSVAYGFPPSNSISTLEVVADVNPISDCGARNTITLLFCATVRIFFDGAELTVTDIDRVAELMKDTREDLCKMVPKTGKHDVMGIIAAVIFSPLMNSEHFDMEYLGRIYFGGLIWNEIVFWDVGAFLTVAKYQGDFKERILHVLKEVAISNGRSVLFIDEFVADVMILLMGARAILSYMDTMFGDRTAQEITKACSGMFQPIFQLLYFVSIESLPKSDLPHYIDNNSISELRTILFKGGGDDTDMDTGSNEELILIIGNECCADFKARGVCLLTMEEGRDLMVLRRNTLFYCAAVIACTSNGEQPEVGLRRSALGNCDAVVGFAD